MEKESSHPDKKGLQQMILSTSAHSCSPQTVPPQCLLSPASPATLHGSLSLLSHLCTQLMASR